MTARLTKSRQRVAEHGEVFTPAWMVEAMLDLVKGESERIDARFLEPACGSGNFLVPIVQRKLAAVELKYGKCEFEKRQFALLALMCSYGIELLADNVAECRANLLAVFAQYLELDAADDMYRAAAHVLALNIVHGDALTMKVKAKQPITFAEWGYLGNGRFQRRDFRFDVLTHVASFIAPDSLFSSVEKSELLKPDKVWPAMTVAELARAGAGEHGPYKLEDQPGYTLAVDLHNIPTLQIWQGFCNDAYTKIGFYRSDANGDPLARRTHVVYHDGLVQGTSFDAVTRWAHGSEGMPKF